MNEWIQAHWPEGGLIALGFALVKWLLGREIKRIEKRDSDHEERLRKLEEKRITQDDIDELRMSLMAHLLERK